MRVNTIINAMVKTDNIDILLIHKMDGVVNLDETYYSGTIQDMPKECRELKVVNITSGYVDAEETYSSVVLTTIDDKGVIPKSWEEEESDIEDEDWD